MTPKEFKAWFEGFTEAMSGLPNEGQWKKIQARVAQIDGTPVSYPVYVRDYWPRYIPYRESWASTSMQGSAHGSLADKVINAQVWNSSDAMLALGKADYEAN